MEPIANRGIIGSAQEMTLEEVVPRQTITLLGVTSETKIRLGLSCSRGGGVFGVVKEMDLTRYRLGGNQTRVLGHVLGSIHLSFMAYALYNADLALKSPKASKLSLFFLILANIQACVFCWHFDSGNQQVVGLCSRGVCSQNHPMRPRLVFLAQFDIWKPLNCKRWPFKCMGHYHVIKEGSIFLPDLVFFIDNFLLFDFSLLIWMILRNAKLFIYR